MADKYIIQANPSGTRQITVSEENLETIDEYYLFTDLIDSNGIVDESVLEKLRLNLRSLIVSLDRPDKNLVDLAIDVIFHNDMKAFGLHQLIMTFINWCTLRENSKESETTENQE